MKPVDADFGVTIDFQKGLSDPVKLFEAISALLEGFRQFDRVAVSALDPHLQTNIVLEDIQASSITAWIKSTLNRLDDQALKELDWKPQIGRYLVKAKYKTIEFLDQKEKARDRNRIIQLRDDLNTLAENVEFRHLPLRSPIALVDLIKPLDQIQDAKKLLSKTDLLTFKTDDRNYLVDLSATQRPSELLADLQVIRTDEGQMRMSLLVRKPDLLGDSMWEFRHGKNTITARVSDEKWMGSFRAGREFIRPGSSLSCTLFYQYGYDSTDELQTIKHEIIKVHSVVNQVGGEQTRLLED